MPKQRKKRRRFVSTRQRELFKAMCRGISITAAAAKAGYSSPQAAWNALKGHRKRVEEAMAEAGLTHEGLVNKYLKPALNAEETEFAKYEGKITDQVNVVAWGPRLTALDYAFKLNGSYAPREFAGPESSPLFPTVIDTTGMRRQNAKQLRPAQD
jgi:phage terminase small subunit